MRHPPELRSSRRKPRVTERGPWIPACAGMNGMERRAFITALAAAAAWPRVARAQQMPVIGYLNGAPAAGWEVYVSAFLRGLAETGYAEGKILRIEYRWADNQYDRLPGLATDLV